MPAFARQNFGRLTVDLVDLPPLAELEAAWRDLEARSEASFFTSWSWIGTWLRNLPADVQPLLLRARIDDRLMGAGILIPSVVWKARCIPIRTWRLHETGQRELDEITIEYNGLVIDASIGHLVEPMMMQYLIDHGSQWDELQFNALRRPPLPPKSHRRAGIDWNQTRLKRVRRAAYQINLGDVRQAGQHVQLIKQKTRYHIRRSLSAFEAFGPVVTEVAQTVEQALGFLARLKHYHQAYWDGKNVQGAFSHPHFNAFHEQLIRSCFDRGEIQLVAVKAGEQEIAYLYNFVWQGHVYNYQSGVNYADMGGKNSPGLASHTLTIDLNAGLGHHTYDLMVGDHHYKRALTLQTVQLDWWSARSPTLPNRVEDSLRKAAGLALQMSAHTHRLPDWLAASAPVALSNL
ncbi:MAG: GNAT family N-acetyltransferase [Acidobacteriota bacterium]